VEPTAREGIWEGPLTRTDHGDIPGGKDLMSERGTHVPLIIDWPRYRSEHKKCGNACEDLVDFSDFFVTVAELAEAQLPGHRPIDGVSFASRLRGEGASKRKYIFCHYWEFGRKQEETRESVRDARWKLYDDGRFYDLAADIEERSPLQELNADAEAARHRLEQVLEEIR
jgi:arylsulfatase A